MDILRHCNMSIMGSRYLFTNTVIYLRWTACVPVEIQWCWYFSSAVHCGSETGGHKPNPSPSCDWRPQAGALGLDSGSGMYDLLLLSMEIPNPPSVLLPQAPAVFIASIWSFSAILTLCLVALISAYPDVTINTLIGIGIFAAVFWRNSPHEPTPPDLQLTKEMRVERAVTPESSLQSSPSGSGRVNKWSSRRIL